MNLADNMLDDTQIKMYNSKGELIPDPNLIRNIDHLTCFIELEIEDWANHSLTISNKLKDKPLHLCTDLLFEDGNVRRYLKSLFNISTYYVACVEAMDKLISQLNKLNSIHFETRIKKPKLQFDDSFHTKAKLIRNISFLHQDSNKTPNPMNKRTAMSWFPQISSKIGCKPNCENYIFGGAKWFVKVDGVKTETEIDIIVYGLSDFASKAKEQVLLRKTRLLDYYQNIQKEINSNS